MQAQSIIKDTSLCLMDVCKRRWTSCKMLLDEDPTMPKLHYALALVCGRLKRTTEAQEALKKFHELQASQAGQSKGGLNSGLAAPSMHDESTPASPHP